MILRAGFISAALAASSLSGQSFVAGSGAPKNSAPDFIVRIPQADGAEISLPIDADTLGAKGALTAEFLFELDLSKITAPEEWQRKVDAYQRQLVMEQRKYKSAEAKEMIAEAVRSTIKAHLIETHGWTLARIEETVKLARGELAKREAQADPPARQP